MKNLDLVAPFGAEPRRLALNHAVWRWVLLAFLCFGFARPVKASGTLTMGGEGGGVGNCFNATINPATSTVEVNAALSGLAAEYLQQVNSFVIVVNGTSYTATTSASGGGLYGKAIVPLTQSPMRLICYARATVTWSYMSTQSESFDSRNSPTDPNHTFGQGRSVELIYADIKLRGLRFDGRACDVYNHRDGLTYPINSGSQKYHWLRDNPVSSTISGPYPAAYLKGSSPQLTIQTEPLSSVPVRIKATISASTAFVNTGTSASPAGYPFTTTSVFSGSSTTLALPALLNCVNIYTISATFNFQCQMSNGTWSDIYPRPNDTVSLRLYAVNAQPVAPMATPWMGVLEDSCRFAANQSTDTDVAKEETRGVYFSKRLAYPYSTASRWTDGGGYFTLTNFLNTSGYQSGNCADVSDYLSICAASQGLTFSVQQYANADTTGTPAQMQTNPVCLIGGSPLDLSRPDGSAQWATSSWAWHQICFFQSNVYDSCAAHKFDLSGNFYGNPPINWPLNGYWQTNTSSGPIISGGSTWNHLGLVDYTTVRSSDKLLAKPNNPSTSVALAPSFQVALY